MILDKTIDIKMSYRNISYYKDKGYNVDLHNIIKVKIDDLPRNSRALINIKCLNCNDEKQLTYNKYMDNYERYGFYTCHKCSTIKKKKTFNINYGVDNPMKVESIKEKGKKTKFEKYGDENYNNMPKYINTCNEVYGTDYALSSNIIREKINNTIKNKYGVNHISELDYFKNKIQKSNSITKFNNSIKIYKEKHNLIIIDKIDDKYKLKCDKCNQYYLINSNLLQLRILYDNELCLNCNPIGFMNISQIEKQLLNFIKENYKDEIVENSKKIIKPYELDIYLPDLKLAFEFNGLYWHNELNKDKNYHKNKSDLCEEKGIQLIHIYEDDWEFKKDIVKSMILNKFKKSSNRIFARKTEIREITDNKLVKNFLNKNHIQGFVGSSIKLGLFFENELVSLMTFGKLRKMMNLKSTDNKFELIRFCNKLNTNVIGGASKLFKHFIKEYNPEYISSYADRSYSNGNLYKKLGFNIDSLTPPNHYYIVDNIRKHRFNFRKSNLIKQGFDKNKTSKEIMLERKIYRIYNSGNYKFIFKTFF